MKNRLLIVTGIVVLGFLAAGAALAQGNNEICRGLAKSVVENLAKAGRVDQLKTELETIVRQAGVEDSIKNYVTLANKAAASQNEIDALRSRLESVMSRRDYSQVSSIAADIAKKTEGIDALVAQYQTLQKSIKTAVQVAAISRGTNVKFDEVWGFGLSLKTKLPPGAQLSYERKVSLGCPFTYKAEEFGIILGYSSNGKYIGFVQREDDTSACRETETVGEFAGHVLASCDFKSQDEAEYLESISEVR